MRWPWTTRCLCRAVPLAEATEEMGERLFLPWHNLFSFPRSSYQKTKQNSISYQCSTFCHLKMQRAILCIHHLQDHVPPDNRTDPLCGFYSLADVQVVTLDFITIGRCHLRERESMARGLGRGRERQTGWLAGVWREAPVEGRGGWAEKLVGEWRWRGEEEHTQRRERKKAFSQHLKRAGLAFRQAARTADGLETHCESHLGLQSSRPYRSH